MAKENSKEDRESKKGVKKQDKKSLDKFKKEFINLQKIHNLPEFKGLNEDFGIEKISEVETDYLVREIRKFMADKIYNYMRFVETLLHPVNAPMFYFSILKSLGAEDKKLLNEIYKKLIKIEIELIEADVAYNEVKEIELIKLMFFVWQEIKEDTLRIIKTIKDNDNVKFDTSKSNSDKGYFG